MRKLFALTLLLSACSPVTAPADHRSTIVWPDGWGGDGYHIGTFTDPDTDCQYLFRAEGGITPRLGRDGIPICGERWRAL